MGGEWVMEIEGYVASQSLSLSTNPIESRGACDLLDRLAALRMLQRMTLRKDSTRTMLFSSFADDICMAMNNC